MRAYVVFILAALACAVVADYQLTLEGLQGFHVKCNNQEDLLKIQKFEDINGFDILRHPRSLNESYDILVEAAESQSFRNYLTANGIEYEVFIENFQRIIEEETLRQNFLRSAVMRSEYGFKHFPRHFEINDYLSSVATKYGSLATLINIGKSYEGRDMLGVRISTGGGGKPVVFIDAGFHAREWIAPTTALYIINELVKPANRNLLDKVDVIVIPAVNPDGYEYSHTNYRLWRKTRARYDYRCYGVDPNRNFGYKWNLAGASQNPCSDVYSGPKAFSEIETRNVRDAMLALNGTMKVYLSLHSYGQMLLHPWGWTNQLPDNEPLLRKVGLQAAKAVAAIRGKEYVVGSSTIVLYKAAGGSDDWAMAVGKADISYTMELPENNGGFVISAEEIVPIGYESFQAVKVFIAYAASTAK